jgi:predicted RecA/RadA family phage recombinase
MSAIAEDIVYDDLRDITPNAAVTQGQIALVQDVVGFYLYAKAADNEVTFLYRCKQVKATKATGSGTEITSGQKLYVDLTTGVVTNVYSTGLYLVGWAKEDAGADDSTVLMRWDGTLWEAIT